MGNNYGIWVGDDDDIIERFDSAFADEPTYSRSEAIKDAMELAIVVDNALEHLHGIDADGRQRRALVRQALIDQLEDDSDG